MNKYIKAFTLLLAIALIFITAAPVGVSAAEEAEFSVNVKSENASEVTVSVNLIKGMLNSVDMELITGKRIGECTSLIGSDILKKFMSNADPDGGAVSMENKASKKVAFITTDSYTEKGEMYVAVFKKNTAEPVSRDDIQLSVSSCSVSLSPGRHENVKVKISSSLPELTGICGKEAYFIFREKTGELEILGRGETADFEKTSLVPWNSVARKIKSITISDGITVIGKNLFSGLINVKKVILPAAVTKINESAFAGCTGLEKINIDKVSSIGIEAFKNCKKLNGIALSASLTEINAGTFKGCAALGKLEVGKQVTEIDDSAFEGCPKLVIRCDFGSYAYKYAVRLHINFELINKKVIGDVNSDGYINSTDALSILRHAVNIITFTDSQKILADINKDNSINSVDALIVLEIAVEKTDPLIYQK